MFSIHHQCRSGYQQQGFWLANIGAYCKWMVSWAVREQNGCQGRSHPPYIQHQPVAPNVLNKGLKGGMGIWYQAESNYYYCTNFDLVSMPLGDQTQQRSVLRQSRMESAPRKLRQVCEHQWNAFHSSASLDALKQWTSEVEQTGDDENIACPLICTSRPESNKF